MHHGELPNGYELVTEGLRMKGDMFWNYLENEWVPIDTRIGRPIEGDRPLARKKVIPEPDPQLDRGELYASW